MARRRRRQRGQALIEYSFLLVLLVMVVIAVFTVVGNQVLNTYQNIETGVQRALGGR